jgi:hypothetical protein
VLLCNYEDGCVYTRQFLMMTGECFKMQKLNNERKLLQTEAPTLQCWRFI